jgi:hypothetical protein
MGIRWRIRRSVFCGWCSLSHRCLSFLTLLLLFVCSSTPTFVSFYRYCTYFSDHKVLISLIIFNIRRTLPFTCRNRWRTNTIQAMVATTPNVAFNLKISRIVQQSFKMRVSGEVSVCSKFAYNMHIVHKDFIRLGNINKISRDRFSMKTFA